MKTHRAEYYDRLTAIRNDGNWEGWLKFFLRGVDEVSREAINTARRIFALRDEHRNTVNDEIRSGGGRGLLLLDYLYEQPMINVRMVERRLGTSFVTASELIERFVTLEILKETTGGQRHRRYSYAPYLTLFESSEMHNREKATPIEIYDPSPEVK